MHDTFDETMNDPLNSHRDKTEWMYRRRTELENAVYRGGRLTADEEEEIERIDQRLDEIGAIPYTEMVERMTTYFRQRWGNASSFTHPPSTARVCPDCKFWQPLSWDDTPALFGSCLSPHLGTSTMVTGRDAGCRWWQDVT